MLTSSRLVAEETGDLTPEDLLSLYQRSWGPLGIPMPSAREVHRSIDDAVQAACLRDGDRLVACLVAEAREAGEWNLLALVDPTVTAKDLAQKVSAWLTAVPTETHRLIAAVPDGDATVRSALQTSGFQTGARFLTMHRPKGSLTPGPKEAQDTTIAFDPGRQEEVRRLCNDAFRGHWGTTAWSQQDWQDDVIGCERFQPGCSFLHLDDDGLVDAFVLSSRDSSSARRVVDVDLLGTRTDARGRGLATMLLRRTIAASNLLGCSLELVVHQDGDQGALHIYRSLGFQAVASETILVLERP